MTTISRQTIIFFLPLQLEAISGSQNSYSVTHPGHPDPTTGMIDPLEVAANESENTGEDGDLLWARKQLYINPQTINIREKKFIKSDLTKGGFVTQYWGEDLTSIEVNGTTGSAGIEGISILRGIYRHEQTQYRDVLKKRQEALAAATKAAAQEAEALLAERTGLGGTLTNIADVVTGGAYSSAISGVTNAVDIMMDAFTGGGSFTSGTFTGVPSLAAFATNIDMYHQGEFFRGYFENFSVTETSQEPGLFTYQFTFKVTRRTGERTNFMPWHRDPYTSDGTTRMTEQTTVSKGIDGAEYLTFPLEAPEEEESSDYRVSSNFSPDTASDKVKDSNNVGVSRQKSVSGE